MGRAPRNSLDALTGARFFAAFWVVIYHFVVEFRFYALPGKPAPSTQLPTGLAPILTQGHLAVDFFFLLSGFILAYTYVTPERTLRGSRREFWVARIARIYPVYLLGLALALPQFIQVTPDLMAVGVSGVAHLLMIHSWIPSTLEWNQPSWSLGVEAFFYAFFPLLLPLAARLRRRGLWSLLIISWLVFVAIVGALYVLSHHGGFAAIPGWRDIVRYNPLVSFPEFIMGMALGLLFTLYGHNALPFMRRANGPVFDTLILGALAVFGVLLFSAQRLGIYGGLVDTLAPFVAPPLIAVIFLMAFQRGLIVRLLSLPLVVWLGEISYGIYILHLPVWYLVHAPLWAALNGVSLATVRRPASDLALFLVYSMIVIILAGLSFQFLEGPTRRAIRARWGQPDTPRATPVFPNMLTQGQARSVAQRDSHGESQAAFDPDATRM